MFIFLERKVTFEDVWLWSSGVPDAPGLLFRTAEWRE